MAHLNNGNGDDLQGRRVGLKNPEDSGNLRSMKEEEGELWKEKETCAHYLRMVSCLKTPDCHLYSLIEPILGKGRMGPCGSPDLLRSLLKLSYILLFKLCLVLH
jgi:hypothetical protein